MILSPTASMRMPDSTGRVDRVDTPFITMDRALDSSVRLMLSFKTGPFLGVHSAKVLTY